jgi:hypothetical protein
VAHLGRGCGLVRETWWLVREEWWLSKRGEVAQVGRGGGSVS